MMMQTITFVIGATATGKTYFINQNYSDKDIDILNIYDYQQQAYDEAGFGDKISFGAQFRCLKKAQDALLDDIITRLRMGRDIVVEQTFYKAKRRIAYIEKIRREMDVTIRVFVMCPSESRWKANIERRNLQGRFESYKNMLAEIEFPNPVEGIDEIYEVTDGAVALRMDSPRPEILDKAKEELVQETKRIRKEDEVRRKKKELVESMNTRPFWHYCEACGKKAYLTARQAFNSGWDYPPDFGSFGLLSQRTCGECSLKDTLYMKVIKQKIPIVVEAALTPEELTTWKRIKGEPESLLSDEDMNGECQ